MAENTPDAPSPSSIAHRFGAPRDATVPRMENVRITAPDLARRAALEKTRGRLVFAACGFAVLFSALIVKLADATILDPVQPKHDEVARRAETHGRKPPITLAAAEGVAPASSAVSDLMPHAQRAMITDRNGEILAISLPMAGLYANPQRDHRPGRRRA